MPICRIIFRLDFVKPIYQIIDSPGQLMKIIDTTWQKDTIEIGENYSKRLVSSRYMSKENQEGIIFNVDPKNINFSFEKNVIYSKVIKCTNEIRRSFDINEIKRAGLRVFYFDTLSHNTKLCFLNTIDKCFTSKIQTSLGAIEDLGISFDGTHDDGIKYHYQTGPYFEREATKYLQYFPGLFNSNNNYNIVSDFDLYEENFELTATVSIVKWIQSLIEKIKNTTELINLFISQKN